MVYDMRNHLPQLIEELRQDIRTGNIPGLKANKRFSEKSYSGFESSFKAIEHCRDEERWKSLKNYVIALNEAIDSNKHKRIDDAEFDAALAYNKYSEKREDHERDYWETILAKTIKFNQGEYEKELSKRPEEHE